MHKANDAHQILSIMLIADLGRDEENPWPWGFWLVLT
jgi:hypothetical protein